MLAGTWSYAPHEQVIAPHAFYGTAIAAPPPATPAPIPDRLAYLGWTYYDSSATDGSGNSCDCTQSTLSGPLSPTALTIANFDVAEVTVDASSIANVVDTATEVKDFCGDFKFVIEEFGAASWEELPAWVEPCESNCLIDSTTQSYKLASIKPDHNDLFGTHKFTINTDLTSFPGQAIASTFDIDVTYCNPEFVPIGSENGFRHINPVFFIVGKDSEMYLDVPEFMLTQYDCRYEKKMRTWIEIKEKPHQENTEIEIHPFPDNIRYFYSQNDRHYVVTNYLEISGQTWDHPEDLIGTNVTLHF